MSKSRFGYVTFIRTTPEILWSALTSPEFTRKYWFGMHQESDWTAGSPWSLVFSDGRIADRGRIIESDPPRRLAIEWQNEFRSELKEEGPTLCTMELEPIGEAVKLIITHSAEQADSKLIASVSGGWPRILSNLKSLIETGEVVLHDKS